MLDVMDFSLDKQEDGKFCLVDGQDAYLGDVESYSGFENGNASAIIERLDTFLGDYYFGDLEEAAESEFGIDLSADDAPVTAEEWVVFLDKHEDFKKEYIHEYEVMRLISSPDDVDLIDLDDVVHYFSGGREYE